MRTVHRILSICALLFLFYVGVTGTWIQLIDMSTIVGGAPETDLTMQSINEGKFGNRPYSVVALQDWGAQPLPQGLDYAKTIAVALPALEAQVPGKAPTFVELRVAKGTVVAQAEFGKDLIKAVDTRTGAAVAPVELKDAKPPKSLRQTLKQWHRFWGPNFVSRRDKPGVYIELAVGLALWTLIVTGLTVYFRLLKQRRRMRKPQLFWKGGGIWRELHRMVSVCAAVLLILVAASGTWLGFESSWNTFAPRGKRAQPAPLSDDAVARLAAGTQFAWRAAEPNTPIRVFRVREYAGIGQGVVVTGTSFTRQLVFDTATGKELALSDPRYPKVGFPLGMDVHEWVKHFHSGYLWGLPARALDLLAGLSLVFLTASGLVMYVQMYRKRRLAGRGALLWT